MKKFFVPTMLVLATISSTALAQAVREAEERIVDQTTTARTGAPGGQDATLDKHIAVCLTLGNEGEIALAEFAKQRTQNDQVKQFADTMIEQHQQALSKLEQAVPQVADINLSLQGGQSGQAATRRDPQAQPGQAGGPHAMVALERQAAQNRLQLTASELGQKQGAEFDKAYIGQQCVAHIDMLAKLKASEQFASANLKPVIQEGAQMAQQHLTKCKEIMKTLDGARAQTSQRPAGAPAERR